jgi:adenylate cyclase
VENFVQRLEDCRATAAHALELDPRDPRALRYYGGASCFLGDQDTALGAVTRSIELCPCYASAYSGLAFVHDFRGQFSDAVPAADETIRLRPHDPALHRCVIARAIAHYQTGQYEQAERIARDSLRTNSSWWLSNLMLAASLAQRGRLSDAHVAAQRIREHQPEMTLDIMLQRLPFADRAHSDHLAEGLIRTGWRDG